MKKPTIICLVAVLLLGLGFQLFRWYRIQNLSHPWLAPPPATTTLAAFTSLPPQKIKQVKLAQREAAARLLADKSFTKLSKAQAASLAEGALLKSKSEQVYLVRAVDVFDGQGSFTVDQHKNTIWIQNGAMGQSISTPIASPVLVVLKIPPRRVWITWFSVH